MMDWHELGIDTRGRTRGQLKTRCPKCGPTARHRNKMDLSVDLDRGLYNCHNPGCDFRGRIGSAPDWRDWQPSPTYVRPSLPAERVLRPNGRAFFAARGIDPDIAVDMGVYSDPDDTAIAMPYTRDGDVVHVKYRSITDKRFWSTKDTEPVFYNLDGATGASVIVIVEGEMDALALMTVGVDSVVSLPNGAPNPGQSADGKLECLKSAERMLDEARQIIIAVDTDAPGQALTDELVRRIGPAKCSTVTWADGCKDANDVLMTHGATVLAECIARARPVPISGLIYADDVREDIWRNREGRMRQGVEVPQWPRFNEHFRMGEAQLTVVTGTPSSGKSAFIAALCVHVATNDPSWSFAFFTPEEAPPDDWFAKVVQLKLGRRLDQVDRREFDAAMDWVDQHFILQSPEDPTLPNILELARACVFRHGIKGVVIDPYTEVNAERLPGVGESEHVGNNLAMIRGFGQRHRTHMVVAAHPVKPDRASVDQPVGPYDISGSANWFNKADMILSVFRRTRDGDASPVDVYISKARKAQFGKVGCVSFGFHQESGRYYEIQQGEA